MRWSWLVLVAGCSFQSGAAAMLPGTTSGDDGGVADVAATTHDARPTDGNTADGPATAAACDVPDPTGLVLCLEFDDASLATMAIDSSGKGHNATSNVPAGNLVTRTVPITSQAIQVVSTTEILVADSADFDAAAYTAMAWVHRENQPNTGGLYSVIDLGQQFAIAINDDATIGCALQVSSTESFLVTGPAVTLNEWDVLACTYDGTNVCDYVFHGSSTTPNTTCTSIGSNDTASTAGIAIGSATAGGDHLAGKLDSALLFTRTLTASEICAAAGLTGC